MVALPFITIEENLAEITKKNIMEQIVIPTYARFLQWWLNHTQYQQEISIIPFLISNIDKRTIIERLSN